MVVLVLPVARGAGDGRSIVSDDAVAGSLSCCVDDAVVLMAAVLARGAGAGRGVVSDGVVVIVVVGSLSCCVDDVVVLLAAELVRGAGVGRDAVSAGVALFSDSLEFEVATAPSLLEVEAVRRRVTLGACSWLAGVALSDFERALLRLLVGVVFACSFPSSGDSDVFFMKKTPFYRIMRHEWRRNLSSQPQKRTVPFSL